MTIDVYADIACPWCYVGRARLKQVLQQRPETEVTLRWRPFQLQPDMPAEGRDFRSVLSTKFGSWERAQGMFERIRALGAENGLSFNFDAIDVAPNTANAHRLVLWAETHDAGDDLATALFRAYFSDGQNVSDTNVLAECAADAGLNAEDARALLKSNEYAEAVRKSQVQAQRRGISGVPCYIFNDEHVVSGAQPVEVFASALDSVGTPSADQ